MRFRPRHVHMIEALVDNVVGFVINLALVQIVFNWMLGQDITMTQNLTAGVVFFIVAWVRKYTIRRWSSNLIQRIFG